MTFSEICKEVSDCGLDHLTPARIGRLVNLSYQRIYNRDLWPWRLTETSETAPVSLSGTIRQVIGADGFSLTKSTAETIENNGYVLTQGGRPELWYLDSQRNVAVFPQSNAQITVRYYAKTLPLTGNDIPNIPADYHYLIVLDAVRRGKLENGEIDAAAAYANDFNELYQDLKRDVFNEDVAGGLQLNDLTEGI